ncbi:decarboxylating 6-phosphogluconate dehydrogenase [Thermithiobacillus tepidarius DSM 3134]|uniref:phosphogluconate dehydrogenase (NAD(+)-dependent, decarboxylating) n=1 Tax=Thermithiobacillus tepidarius TaxID=929 RepID=UPI000413874A|nr:decarboxylating 6-phosphogluconate dehydrogenase [Thermithiobacillus tepidarius]
MQIAIVGLGRMGGNMARRLRRAGLEVVAYNRNGSVTDALAAETGLQAVHSLEELIQALPAPRIVWLMLPAGDATQQHIDQLVPLLSAGDVLVDGGNAFYKDSMARGQALAAQGLHFVDAGVSGGVWGLDNGYALMVGGADEAVQRLEPFLKALAPAPDKGWLHCGPVGSGHFVKMVHNGIEYGMMQAFAEGFALLKGREDFDLDLAAVAEMWRHGSVVRSWLLDLTADFLKQDQELADVAPVVADSGEGRWTAMEAIEQGVPAPVISLALAMRFASQGRNDYPAKLLAMMRKGFGGHFVATQGGDA